MNNANEPEVNVLSKNAVAAAGVKEKLLPTTRDRLFFLAAFAVCFTLFELALGHRGIGVSIYFILLYVMSGIYLLPWKCTSFYPIFSGALGLVLSVGFSFSFDPTVTFFSIIAVEFLYLVFVGGISKNLVHGTDTAAVVMDAGRIMFGDSVEEIGAIFRTGKGIKDGGVLIRNIFKCALGIVIAVPLLCIVFPLLMEADGAFDAFITNITEIELGFEISALIYAAFLCPLTCGMIFSLKHKQAKLKPKPQSDFARPKGFDPIATAGFLGVLSLCYLLYVYSQLGYFFSAFGGDIPETVKTAASYARRGFFELCAISVINFVAIAAAMFKTRTERGYGVCKAFATFISAFSMLLIGTALSKMLLYIKLYGLTVRRLLPSLFMVLLALAFVLLAIRIFKRAFPYMRIFASACAVMLIFMNFVDLNALSANYNVAVYLDKDAAWHTETVEVDYLRSIAEPALPALVRLWDETDDPEVAFHASMAIDRIENDLNFNYEQKQTDGRNWRDTTVTAIRADKALEYYHAQKNSVKTK